jgi:hypothetical protein
MSTRIPATLKRLVTSSVLYILLALVAALAAITANRSADPLGESTGLPVVQDFLYGKGTAMSPPLYWLVGQAILTALARRLDRWGAVCVVALTIIGLLFGVFGFAEPIVLEIFNPATFDVLKAIIVTGTTILAFLMMVFGILELVRRGRGR